MDFYNKKEEIEEWLIFNDIEGYSILEDKDYGYVVDIEGGIYLHDKKLKKIPIKFNIVKGIFDCSNNELTSLDFCPKEVGSLFACNGNELTNLKGCPEIILGSFSCIENNIKNLIYIPQRVDGNFYCNDNKDLGDLQKISDFNKIKEIHIEQKTKYELEKLNTILNNMSLTKNIKKNKV